MNDTQDKSGRNLHNLYILTKRYLTHLFIGLTRFFPFSLLSKLTWMNYQNREVYQAYCAIWDSEFFTGIHFNVDEFYKDENFVCFKGKFKKVAKGSSVKKFVGALGKIYGDGNVYVNNLSPAMFLLRINRNVALDRTYYSFLAEVHNK